MILDFVAYRTDFTVGRGVFHQALPYYEDATTAARWTKYGHMAEFASGQQMSNYLQTSAQLVNMYLAKMNQGPVILHEMPKNWLPY